MTVFLQAYEADASAAAPGQPSAAASTTKPLIAFVSFYEGQNKVYETQPEEVSPNSSTSLHTAGINFNVDLSSLAPDKKYMCQVTVLDPTSGKTAYNRNEIMIVP
jgi:hypothetical protein